MMNRIFTLFVAMVLTPLSTLHAVEVLDLRCDYHTNPIGIDAEKPGLSWKIEDGDPKSGGRGLRQSAYQVLVASSEDLLKHDKGDVWDSGKMVSNQSNHIEYAGKPPRDGTG